MIETPWIFYLFGTSQLKVIYEEFLMNMAKTFEVGKKESAIDLEIRLD